MVNLIDYKSYLEVLQQKLSIDNIVLAVQEEHLTKLLKGSVGTVLAVVYPDAAGSGTADNVSDVNQCLLFLLEHNNEKTSTPDIEFQSYAKLQQIASDIKDRIVEDADDNLTLLIGLDRASFTIEPVWNYSGSYIGYAISFSFEK